MGGGPGDRVELLDNDCLAGCGGGAALGGGGVARRGGGTVAGGAWVGVT